MISVSTKMPYQEVREISLRSGKVRKNESRKKSGLKFEKSGHPVRFLKLIPQNHLIGMTKIGSVVKKMSFQKFGPVAPNLQNTILMTSYEINQYHKF